MGKEIANSKRKIVGQGIDHCLPSSVYFCKRILTLTHLPVHSVKSLLASRVPKVNENVSVLYLGPIPV